jgi:hypothetical protein
MSAGATPRPFAGLVQECARRDIGRTTAFDLANKGLIETFKIGGRRFVYLDSLDTLPGRIPDNYTVRRAPHDAAQAAA